MSGCSFTGAVEVGECITELLPHVLLTIETSDCSRLPADALQKHKWECITSVFLATARELGFLRVINVPVEYDPLALWWGFDPLLIWATEVISAFINEDAEKYRTILETSAIPSQEKYAAIIAAVMAMR